MTTSAPGADGAVGDGLVLIDKPAGWTSHDVVARVRRLAGTRKVGHAGTLDPMATGLLVLGINRATRLLTYLVGADKSYTATIRLGQDTRTDDAEGEVTAAHGAGADVPERLAAAMADLTGAIAQRPSAVSAIKVDGKRAYARVRAGEDVQLDARQVQVTEFVLTDEVAVTTASDGTPVLDVPVRVVCSSGTYIRALARDLGATLGTGGHLTALRRTRVGAFGIDAAQPLGEPGQALEVLSVTEAATRLFDVRRLTEDETTAIGYGQFIAPGGASADVVAGIDPDGEVIALLREQDGKVRPVLVLRPS